MGTVSKPAGRHSPPTLAVNVVVVTVLAFLVPWLGLLAGAYAMAWALRDGDRSAARRYKGLVLLSLVTTGGWVATSNGQGGWTLLLLGIAIGIAALLAIEVVRDLSIWLLRTDRS